MVLFENITINQRVEVLQDGAVMTGIVRYKGCLNGIRGEWVGIELDEESKSLSLHFNIFSSTPVTGHYLLRYNLTQSGYGIDKSF